MIGFGFVSFFVVFLSKLILSSHMFLLAPESISDLFFQCCVQVLKAEIRRDNLFLQNCSDEGNLILSTYWICSSR